ncbi:hypothetical protein F2Q69_00034508 [Brassica cretica]|uniref:Uncharacterized protein n=1 Tax=Brassica cretica TaxID=69181 RepID=A0A8S9SJA7_BRACR|nr:hypothetical protein F2Q69_00034508 [Brassica cretica]
MVTPGVGFGLLMEGQSFTMDLPVPGGGVSIGGRMRLVLILTTEIPPVKRSLPEMCGREVLPGAGPMSRPDFHFGQSRSALGSGSGWSLGNIAMTRLSVRSCSVYWLRNGAFQTGSEASSQETHRKVRCVGPVFQSYHKETNSKIKLASWIVFVTYGLKCSGLMGSN